MTVYIFFFKEPATTYIYTHGHTLSLHNALPICRASGSTGPRIFDEPDDCTQHPARSGNVRRACQLPCPQTRITARVSRFRPYRPTPRERLSARPRVPGGKRRRPEERRVGKECVLTFRSRVSTYS